MVLAYLATSQARPARLVHVARAVVAAPSGFRRTAGRFEAPIRRRHAGPSIGAGLRPISRQIQACTRAMAATVASGRSGGDEKLVRFREKLAENGVDAYIVPTADMHQSEYAPNFLARREYLSGFTGSAGTAIVTQSDALVWTDGRYFLQAADELGPEWTLMKAGLKDTPKISEWLGKELKEGQRVGIDPYLHTINEVKDLKEALSKAGIELSLISNNLVDEIWDDQPPAPTPVARVHPPKWAGISIKEKVMGVRKSMSDAKADAFVISKLDEVCWLLNIRGGDIEANPVVLSYAIVLPDEVRLYMEPSKVTDPVREYLEKELDGNISFRDYTQVAADVEKLGAEGLSILMDPSSANIALQNAAISSGGKVVEKTSPIDAPKAIKNSNELDGMREAHLRDGAALAKFFAYVDMLTKAGDTITEYEAGAESSNMRAEQEGYIEPSFPAIAGEGPNGAVIHYRAAKDTSRVIKAGSLLLLDSGGQYEMGTTDVTRVYHFGGDDHPPSPFQKEIFTRVLKGHIAVDTAVFPEGTPGFVLDAFARRDLWSAGLNYLHGTGHGVGAVLNVHEGPHSISPRFTNQTPLKPGMITSNEPGFYSDGSFGIRIENLLVVTEAQTENNFNDAKYLKFEKLTYVPIQSKLIETEMLTDEELKWINDYHRQVWDKISPRVNDQPIALDWLFENTKPIHRVMSDPQAA